MDYPIAFLVFSYLLGAIPFGLLIAKWSSGVDVRQHGSGNIGATNVFRSVGKKEALLTLLADALKGMAPVLLARFVFGDVRLAALAGAAAVVGHIFPVFLKFQGGKGVATALGVLMSLAPQCALGAVAVFSVITYISKYVSLGSITAAVTAPFFAMFFHLPLSTTFGMSFIALLIVIRHHRNIRNLLAGCENKLAKKER